MSNRRSFLQSVLGIGAGLMAAPALASAKTKAATVAPIPVETPDVPTLPFHMEGGVKVFHLTAEPVKREIMPGRVLELWGYNGSVPGPAIQANRGDRVRIVFENRLPEPTSIHWHGLEIPIAMDGMPYISHKPVAPGEKYNYEFTLDQEGTFFYHSHNSMQQMQGMIGMFILHPREAWAPRVDRDFGFVLQEFAALPSNNVPNSAAMEFNWLTFNGKVAPATTPVLVKQGERARMRFTNMGMDHHPIHLHGMTFTVTGTEAGRQAESTWVRKNTVLVGVAEAVDFEFVANNPGDWMVHCHLPHHMMNGMTTPITSGPFDREQAKQFSGPHGMLHNADQVAKNANDVPGFPQDAFMEMVMDEHVAKPETYGLAKGWSAGMMGMMTLVRVLTPEQYDHIMALKQRAPRQEHEHHG